MKDEHINNLHRIFIKRLFFIMIVLADYFMWLEATQRSYIIMPY